VESKRIREPTAHAKDLVELPNEVVPPTRTVSDATDRSLAFECWKQLFIPTLTRDPSASLRSPLDDRENRGACFRR
jgi:hypothetical protein